MSRLDELKKQYPELNVTLIDIFRKLDPTNSYKYLPTLCKILGPEFTLKKHENSSFELSETIRDYRTYLERFGVKLENTNPKEYPFIHMCLSSINGYNIASISKFISLMESNKIQERDVTKYSNFEEIQNAISLAELREFDKEMENEIIREFEDDKWIIIRPLTWNSSAKYGSATRWCTTSSEDKGYFTKYWSNGTLLYIINKITGYKFACYKEFYESGNHELSFWNSADNRVDSMDLEIEGYLFSKLKEILSIKTTNEELSSEEVRKVVRGDDYNIKKQSNVEFPVPVPVDEIDIEYRVSPN